MCAFHDSAAIPPGLVRKILTKDIGLSEKKHWTCSRP